MAKLLVRDIMSTDLVTLDEEEDLDLADTVMTMARIRHLPVVADGALVGLITHRDLLSAQLSVFAEVSEHESVELKQAISAREIMRTNIKTVTPETTVLDAARTMHAKKYGCLPVVEGENLVGIITDADFLELVIRAMEDAEKDG